MKPEKKNETRQQLSDKAKQAFLKRFREDCSRGLRGGLTEEELILAVNEAVVKEVQTS